MVKRGVPFHSSNSWQISFLCDGVGSLEQPSTECVVLPLFEESNFISENLCQRGLTCHSKGNLHADVGLGPKSPVWHVPLIVPQPDTYVLYLKSDSLSLCLGTSSTFASGGNMHIGLSNCWDFLLKNVNLLINIKMNSHLTSSLKWLIGVSSSTIAISLMRSLWINVGWAYLNDN